MNLRIALAFSATLALAACSSTPASESASSEGKPSGGMMSEGMTSEGMTPPAAAATTTPPMMAEECKADAAKSVVGKTATPEVVEQARVASGAATARVITPNMAVTMDFRGDRLNINVGNDNVIGSVGCG